MGFIGKPPSYAEVLPYDPTGKALGSSLFPLVHKTSKLILLHGASRTLRVRGSGRVASKKIPQAC